MNAPDAATLERSHGHRDRDLDPELLRLHEAPSGQRLPGDASGKAEVVLDPGTCACLTAEAALIEDQHREPFGRRVH